MEIYNPENFKERGYSEDLGVDGKIIMKYWIWGFYKHAFVPEDGDSTFLQIMMNLYRIYGVTSKKTVLFNTEMDFRQMACESMDCTELILAGFNEQFCEYGNEILGSIMILESFYHLIRGDSARSR